MSKPSRLAPALTVRDCNLAGALASVGVPPDPRGFEDTFNQDGRTFHCWHFLAQTIDGADRTIDLINAWNNPEDFNRKNPLHRFSFVMMAFKNARHLRKRAASREGYYLLRRGSSVAMVDPGAPREMQDVILQKIGL